jgi:hypothetical protein
MGLSAFTAYEIKAAAFQQMTGMMAPGKDDAMGSHRYEDRQEAWEKWHTDNRAMIDAMLAGAEPYID